MLVGSKTVNLCIDHVFYQDLNKEKRGSYKTSLKLIISTPFQKFEHNIKDYTLSTPRRLNIIDELYLSKKKRIQSPFLSIYKPNYLFISNMNTGEILFCH